MSSFRVEPPLLHALAGRFGELVAEFEALGVAGLEIGDTGDARLTQAIEHFIQRSRGGIGQLSEQFGQVQRVLTATAHGYENVETHVVTEINQNLPSPVGPVGGSIEGDQGRA